MSTSTELSEEQRNLVDSIAENQGFQDYVIEVNSGSQKGDGYLGTIKTVLLKEKKQPSKRLDLIMKSASTNENMRQLSPVKKAYEREMFLYETVLPEIRRLETELGVKQGFTQIAKYFGGSLTEKGEFIILENLKEKGFQLWNRFEPMNNDHIEVVFQSYANLHASSILLRKIKPERFEELAENLVDIFDGEDEEKMKKSVSGIFQNAFVAVAGCEKETNALNRFVEGFPAFMENERNAITKTTSILHGDCWCNNMLFKYEEESEGPSKKPSEMCFLDWQIAKIGSLVFDLSYFFYASGSSETFKKLNDFLKIYHERFSEVLTQGGVDPNEVLTFEELLSEWKKCCKFGLLMSIFVMRVILSQSEEAVDLNETSDAGSTLIDSITDVKIANIDVCNKRIADIITSLADCGFI